MLKRTSTPSSKKNFHKILLQTNRIENCSKSTNTSNDIDDILIQGENMNDNEFEKFIQIHASNSYWKILAERARIKLEVQLRENRQLHELFNELIKENEQLQNKNEQCEYLTNIFNSIISEHDSGIELHTIDESPIVKRQKISY